MKTRSPQTHTKLLVSISNGLWGQKATICPVNRPFLPQTLRKEVKCVEEGSFHAVVIFKYMSVYVQRVVVWMRHTVCREPAEAAAMITHVSASPGHGLLFHSPAHMRVQPHARVLCHTVWSLFLFFFFPRVYHFYTKDARTHTLTHAGLKP